MKLNWEETPYGNYKADVGNYIRLELLLNSKEVWSLYLSIRVFKEDGASNSKLCQHQKVATIGTGCILLVKANAEKWYKEFILDQISHANFSLSELLKG